MSWVSFSSSETNNTNDQDNYCLTIIKAKNLSLSKDDNIYCIIEIGSLSSRTNTIPIGSTWDHIISCFIPDEKLSSSVINIKCYKCGFLSDILIGKCTISLEEHKYVPFYDASPKWFVLTEKSKNAGLTKEIEIKLGTKQSRNPIKLGDGTQETAEEIYKQAAGHAIEGNKSASRSLDLINKFNEINIDTYQTLKGQEIQIDNMRSDIDTLHTNMKRSDRKIRSIESPWGSLVNKITPSTKKNNRKAKKDKKLQQIASKDLNKINSSRTPHKNTIPVRNNNLHTHSSNQGEYEKLYHETTQSTDIILTKLSVGLDDAKHTALQIGAQLRLDDEKLDDLKQNVNKELCNVEHNTRRTRAIINK